MSEDKWSIGVIRDAVDVQGRALNALTEALDSTNRAGEHDAVESLAARVLRQADRLEVEARRLEILSREYKSTDGTQDP